MPLRGDVVGSAEHFLNPIRHRQGRVNQGQAALLRQLLHQLGGIKAFVAGHRLEIGIALDQPGVVHHIADIGQGKERLNAAGGSGDDADGAGGGNRNRGRVPHPPDLAGLIVDAALPSGKDAAPFRQFRRGLIGFLLNPPHHFRPQFQGFLGIVADAPLGQQVGKAHNAHSDAAGFLAHFRNFRDGIVVHINDIVQQMHAGADSPGQARPVHFHGVPGIAHHPGHIQGAQIAGLEGQQRLLAAGIGGLDPAQLGIGIVPVNPIQKDDARIPGLPGHGHQAVKDLFGVKAANHFPGAGVHQVIIPALGDPLHKILGNGDGDVEVNQMFPVLFGVDKAQDVRVVDIQDAHIGPAAGAALFDHIGGGVKGVDKADRAGGHAAGGADHIPLGAQAGKGKAGAAAAFVNQGGLPHPVKDGFQGIVHRQHKAGGKLLQLPAGVHQRGGVGHKLQTPHHSVELLLGGLPLLLRRVVVEVGLGQVAGHPPKHPVRILEDVALPVFSQVAAAQHHLGVVGQLGGTIVDLAADAGGGQGVVEPAARLYGGGLARPLFNGCHIHTLATLPSNAEK